MKAMDLRELSRDELEQKVQEFKRKLFNLRFQKVGGELDNTAELAKTRQDIARAMTIVREKARGEER
ncbi:MAG TPA: 50S ribosomal protein L29 [Candidatus Acetothermia bacterium]|jgi:large subunit ribosomal protein L29|nr:50S ribosomal protein L29 [Candidatus Bipolaricaulota bacterium]HDO74342.1 50S ribosomal protein L29 [Candidatus Acetothermia bacterium]HEX32284.1 50S ribosomal protein L29 [Candidatus Acetothermia bacterium]